MSESIPFIGRSEELEQIKQAIDAHGERRVVCIHGPGGIGKTRLLQEVREWYGAEACISDILDFDDIALRIPANIEFTIARQIGGEVLDAYLQGLQAYYQMRRGDASSSRLAQQRTDIHDVFIERLNRFSTRHRVVLMLDTTDALEGTEVWNYIVSELSQRLKNVALIIAGRNAQKIYKDMRAREDQQAQLIPLSRLGEQESRRYLRQKQESLHITLEPDLAEKLLVLTRGRPILIDLAVEWLARDIPLKWLTESSDAQIQERQEEFECQLVRHIARVRSPMDQLMLAMSHVYPLDMEMISELLKMPWKEAQKLFEEAGEYVFVKALPDGRISLHDEMRRMVDECVWTEVNESRRRWYSELAVASLDHKVQAQEKRIDQLNEALVAPIQGDVTMDPFSKREVFKQHLWTLKVRGLKHRLYLDPDQGFGVFDRLFQEAFRGNESDFCIMLKDTAERYRGKLAEENRIKLDLSRGLLDILRGDMSQATATIRPNLERLLALKPNQGFVAFDRLFQDAFERGDLDFGLALREVVEQYRQDLSQENRVRLDLNQGLLDIFKGNLETAIERIQAALEQLRQLEVTKDLDRIYNSLGYCYRLQGNWERAIESYEQALRYSYLEGDAEQIAETMNNVANVCRFNGDFERGLRYSKVSVKIREKLGDKLSIANSCYVRGMIFWEIGNTSEAASFLERARDLYEALKDELRLAWVEKYVGYFHYRIGDMEAAAEYLERTLPVFRRRNSKSDLTDTLNILSRVTRRANVAGRATDQVFEQAEQHALQGLEIAQEVGDRYRIAECNLTLCALYYRWGLERQIHDRYDQARELYAQSQERYDVGFAIARDGNYIDLLSVYRMIAGNMAYDLGRLNDAQGERRATERRWDEAFGHYLEECRISAAYKDLRFERALNEIASRLMRLPSPELTQKYCNFLADGWRKQGLERRHPQLIAECEQIKAFLETPEASEIAHLSQMRTDLLARGDWPEALEVSRQVLTRSRIYLRTLPVVRTLNASAFALRQMGRFSEARRLCTQSLHIGRSIENRLGIAESNYVMGTIHWIMGNTAEAANALRTAREIFEDELQDPVGVARVRRHEGFLYFRIGNLERALELLKQARIVFEQHRQRADLADALAVEGRILAELGQYEQARQNADQANAIAKRIGNNYILIETLINLHALHTYDALVNQEVGDQESADRSTHLAQQCLREGTEMAYRFGYDLLISVCEKSAGDLAFDAGRIGEAFNCYIAALEYGGRFDYARMHRTLDPCIDRLAQLPEDEIRYFADHVIRNWKARGLDTEFPDVNNTFELIKEYREYVSQT